MTIVHYHIMKTETVVTTVHVTIFLQEVMLMGALCVKSFIHTMIHTPHHTTPHHLKCERCNKRRDIKKQDQNKRSTWMLSAHQDGGRYEKSQSTIVERTPGAPRRLAGNGPL